MLNTLVRHRLAAVAIVVVALSVPYFLAGPHLLADDHVWLRNAHFDGWWDAGGTRVIGRPGGWLTAALTFGAIGPHPAVLYVLLTGLRVVAAVCVLRCLEEFVNERQALAVVLVWIVTPNHLALEMWLSTIAAPIALALLAGGITVLARAVRSGRDDWIAIAYLLLAASAAVYEITAGVAAVAIVAVPRLVGRPLRPRLASAGLAAVAVPLVWAAARSTVYDHGATGSLDPRVIFPGHLSLGLAPFGPQARLVTGVGLAAILWSSIRLALPDRRPVTGPAERLVVAGACVILLGVAPLAMFNTNFFGMNDRLMLVSGVGAAMVWTGAALLAGTLLHQSRLVLAGSAAALLVIAIPVRSVHTREYERAGQEAVHQTRAIAELARSQPVLDVQGPVADVGRVWGLNDGFNVTAAVQLALGTRNVAIGVIIDGQREGPNPTQPAAQF